MTKVSVLRKKANDTNREIKKLYTIKQELEIDKIVLEDRLSSLKEFSEANTKDIEKREKELKALMSELEKAKLEIEPIKGQLSFVNTGYKEAVLI